MVQSSRLPVVTRQKMQAVIFAYESGLRKVPLAASLTLRRLENTKAPARYCRSFITISSAGPPAEVLLI